MRAGLGAIGLAHEASVRATDGLAPRTGGLPWPPTSDAAEIITVYNRRLEEAKKDWPHPQREISYAAALTHPGIVVQQIAEFVDRDITPAAKAIIDPSLRRFPV
jgi:hypothetical protein